MRLAFLMAIFAALSGVAIAQSNPRNCYTGPFEMGDDTTPLRLMRVVSTAPRTQFIEGVSDKTPACPSNAAACQRRGFVVPGDEVLAGPDRNGFTCVTYIAPNVKLTRGQFPETNGFLPSAALAEAPVPLSSPAMWVGQWARSSEAEITLKEWPNGRLWVDGNATFGASDPQRVRRGAINLGQLEGEARPRGNILPLGEGYDGLKPPPRDDAGECIARLRLFGRYMVVEDNHGCGGMNVSFFGVYVRVKP